MLLDSAVAFCKERSPSLTVRALLASAGFDAGAAVDGARAGATEPAEGGAGTRLSLQLAPKDSLHAVAQELERQVYAQLHAQTAGDFAAMAQRLLDGEPAANARRVRLRYNQLGLRVRGKRREK